MTISEIHVHPDHVRGSGYNNLAILKLTNLLDLPLGFQPTCIYHGSELPEGSINAYGNGRRDINKFLHSGSPSLDPTESTHVIISPFLNKTTCKISERFRPKIPQGMTSELVCVGNDVFVVPGSCDLLIGSVLDEWLGRDTNIYHNTIALSQFGRDCGFGEHLIATRLSSHVNWMKSVLLPGQRDSGNVVHFVDRDLREGDSCSFTESHPGRCVPMDGCSVPWREHIARGLITFCSTSSVICCPADKVGHKDKYAFHPDIHSCPAYVGSFLREDDFGSLVQIGWISAQAVMYMCAGTIINEYMIVTTVSCIGDTNPHVVKHSNSPLIHTIYAILKHPAYKATDKTNDIALVRLRDPLSFSSTLFPACLWTNQTHTPIVMQLFHPDGPSRVNTEIVHPMYNSDCQRTHPHVIADSQLCVRNPGRNSTCMARTDQLVWKDQDRVAFLVGLASNASECVQWRFMTYTRISAYLGWISDNAFWAIDASRQ